jgi:UDP-glucose 4-epimerase
MTDPAMTRFMMTLDDAVDLVLFAFENGNPGEIFVQKSSATTIEILAKALRVIMDRPKHTINIIGTRHGEKLFETLLSREEMAAAQDLGSYYRVPPDLRDLNYGKYIEQGELKISKATDYNSHNATRLNQLEMQIMLMKLSLIQGVMQGLNMDSEE